MVMFLNRRKRRSRFITPDRSRKTDSSIYDREFTLENGKAYISCNVDCVGDIINNYSVNGHESPAAGLIYNIDINARHIPEEYPIVLKLYGGDISEKDKATFISALSKFYAARLSDADARLSENLRDAFFQLAFGAIFFFLYLFLNSFDAVTLTFQLCMWFFIWEFADMILIERRTLKSEKRQAVRMTDMEIEFEVRGGREL